MGRGRGVARCRARRVRARGLRDPARRVDREGRGRGAAPVRRPKPAAPARGVAGGDRRRGDPVPEARHAITPADRAGEVRPRRHAPARRPPRDMGPARLAPLPRGRTAGRGGVRRHPEGPAGRLVPDVRALRLPRGRHPRQAAPGRLDRPRRRGAPEADRGPCAADGWRRPARGRHAQRRRRAAGAGEGRRGHRPELPPRLAVHVAGRGRIGVSPSSWHWRRSSPRSGRCGGGWSSCSRPATSTARSGRGRSSSGIAPTS